MISLFAAALAAPQHVQVVYNVRFDVDATGDRLCDFTKLCDCASTYVGAGELVESSDGRLTFAGTWERTANTCSEPLWIWVPADGKAFHTLRHAGGKLSEWVVHAERAKNVRLTEEMKANGQFWMNELAQPWPGSTFAIHQTDGTTFAGAVKLDATHDLAIELK